MKWTDQEVQILKENWATKEARDISPMVGGRSEKSIWAKVKALKLKKPFNHKAATLKRLSSVRTFRDLQRGIKAKVVRYKPRPFTGGKPLSDLRAMECHYCYEGQIYCGEPSIKPHGYCAEHHAACYTKNTCRKNGSGV